MKGLKLRIATANVATLHPGEESTTFGKFGGTLLLKKVELLERSFDAAKLAVIGVQEGRSRSMTTRLGSSYKMLVAVATEGATQEFSFG